VRVNVDAVLPEQIDRAVRGLQAKDAIFDNPDVCAGPVRWARLPFAIWRGSGPPDRSQRCQRPDQFTT
jgi:hypothetical protein